ncbi:DUF4031 domain-containing protein [Ancylobacter sp. SL191]|uniref:DUF4031 domain-containing protein n=1 Tax=Ancylobacter sp. SL191 TaxID=2995166 RepID=UPI00227093A2|nr:DUF4031 domain-containing protein [Ancylobacter sp. SL191]WAC26375.1 DUF4031 domain-containing protein [Ancylobacter sp. SL191]
MTVFVDPAVWPFGRMLMCHMWADTLDELFAMADRIGVQRKWLQGHPTLSLPQFRKASWVHFDIAKVKRAQAVAAGAIETDRWGPLEWEARRQIASGDPALALIGAARLARIDTSRAKQAEAAEQGSLI